MTLVEQDRLATQRPTVPERPGPFRLTVILYSLVLSCMSVAELLMPAPDDPDGSNQWLLQGHTPAAVILVFAVSLALLALLVERPQIPSPAGHPHLLDRLIGRYLPGDPQPRDWIWDLAAIPFCLIGWMSLLVSGAALRMVFAFWSHLGPMEDANTFAIWSLAVAVPFGVGLFFFWTAVEAGR